MIVITNCTTPEATLDGICDFLEREAARYRRDAERERKSYTKAKDTARAGALAFAVELLREARLET